MDFASYTDCSYNVVLSHVLCKNPDGIRNLIGAISSDGATGGHNDKHYVDNFTIVNNKTESV
jgi:hypothetical protein